MKNVIHIIYVSLNLLDIEIPSYIQILAAFGDSSMCLVPNSANAARWSL